MDSFIENNSVPDKYNIRHRYGGRDVAAQIVSLSKTTSSDFESARFTTVR